MKNSIKKKGIGVLSVWLLAVSLMLTGFSANTVTTYAATTAEALIANGTTVFTFSDSAISVSNGDSSSYKVSGTTLTIKSPGTYVLTGSCSEGSVKVKKETTGVTLVLYNLTLSCSDGAPIVINKGNTGTKVIIDGTNTLTDAEDPADETSTDADIADAFEGAALKIKAGGDLTISGSGSLTLNGSSCKNGLKSGDEDADNGYAGTPVTIESGTLNITAANDGIHAYSLTITGGTINVSASDDGIKADYDLNIGTSGSSSGPTINVTNSNEGLEGATVNLYSGTGSITSTDDGINAANSDLTEYTYSLNNYGGTWIINAGGDGLDSNGPLNIYGGYTEVFSSTQSDNAAFDSGDGYEFTFTGGTAVGIGMSGMAEAPTSGIYVQFGSTNENAGMGGMSGLGGMGSMSRFAVPGNTASSSTLSLSSGNTIVIKDSSGNTLYSSTAKKNANSIVFCSDALVSGSTYTLYLNGTAKATATAQGTNLSSTGISSTGTATSSTTDSSSTTASTDTSTDAEGTMYRLYNPNTGEHFYTANAGERDGLTKLGWSYEGIAWVAPTSGVPVYRLYNPNSGDHHYTTSEAEKDYLASIGWNYEGIGWYSDSSETTAVYRLYNPNELTGNHHYTLDSNERDYLTSIGWNYEGIGWYGL